MDCATFKENLLDYAYGELVDPAMVQQMEAHTRECADCAATRHDVGTARRFLSAWDEVTENDAQVNWLPAAKRRQREKYPHTVFRWVAVAAMFVLAAGLFFVVSRTTVRFREGVVEIRIGHDSSSELGLDNPATPRLVNRMIAESEEQQMRKMMDMLQTVYLRLATDRSADRQSIKDGFDFIQKTYQEQIDKNNRLLETVYHSRGAKNSAN